jgi:hypothetical protein
MPFSVFDISPHPLLSNLDRLHTTALGALRIQRNLALEVDDVGAWCRQQIKASAEIYRKGKNWYAIASDCIITINAHSYTIITAHTSPS